MIPYFDDLTVGQVFDAAPSMTLTSGAAAAHQSILGDRMRLPLDATLSHAVTGVPGALAHPALVCDVAIGQSTLVTQRVKANLFYRGLTFHHFPVIGDTLYTRTEVVGLKQNSAKPGRAPTGLAALRMITIDQVDRLVGLDEIHGEPGMPLQERGQDRDQAVLGEGDVAVDPQQAARPAAGGDEILGLLDVPQDRPRPAVVRLALVRQREAARRAAQERDPEPRLKPGDDLAHRRGRDVQRVGRPGEAPGLDHPDEDLHLVARAQHAGLHA